MKLCICGDTVADACTFCARCAALQTLELHRGASADEIKAAYHLLVKVWHPDRFASDKKLRSAAEEKLKSLNSAYLVLTAPPRKQDRSRRARSAASSSPGGQPAPQAPPSQPAAPARSRRPRLRAYLATFAALSIVQRLLVAACGIGVSALFAHFADSQLASDPATAAFYAAYKSAIARELDEPNRRLREQIAETLGRLNPFKPAAAPFPAAMLNPPVTRATDEAPASVSQPSAAHATKRDRAPALRLLPLITVGMTQDEVLAAAGTPISSSSEKLTYKGSEVDFKDGKVAGWKIDPLTSVLRVKLWPDAPVDTSQHVFSIGSTKNDVLVIQGTPTSFSEDMFAYGSSEVYFQNNRVVSWKSDPGSVTLRAIAR
jgi:curved DNA-binding protein CbpA